MAVWSDKSAIWFAKISHIQRFCPYSAKIMWYRFTRGDAYALPLSNCFWAFSPRVACFAMKIAFFSPRVEQKVRNNNHKISLIEKIQSLCRCLLLFCFYRTNISGHRPHRSLINYLQPPVRPINFCRKKGQKRVSKMVIFCCQNDDFFASNGVEMAKNRHKKSLLKC